MHVPIPYILLSMRNNNQKRYIDIPLAIEDTPLHLYEKFTTYEVPKLHDDVGFDLISRIDNAIRGNGDQNELLSLYLNYFEPVNADKFAEHDWPACHEIEGI